MKKYLTEQDVLSTDKNSPLYKKTLCFTGHRKIKEGESIQRMKEYVDFALEIGYRTFLCGMAMGFDSLCFDYVLEKKKKYKDILLVACVPCHGQEKFFPAEEQEKYAKRLKKADLRIILSDKYTSGCMHARNRFMVDRSSCVISYLREETGGTAYTVKYAEGEKVNFLSA